VNKIFSNLLRKWLVTESVVKFFVFELNGFDFLLETIGMSVESLGLNASADEAEETDLKVQMRD
jgi:hypothetical protein